MQSVGQGDEVRRELGTSITQQQFPVMPSRQEIVEDLVPVDEDALPLGHQESLAESAMVVGRDIAMVDIPYMQVNNQQVTIVIFLTSNIIMTIFSRTQSLWLVPALYNQHLTIALLL